MGVDTKGLVTKAKDVNLFALAETLKEALQPFLAKTRFGRCPVYVELSTWTKMALVRFEVQEKPDDVKTQARQLHIFFDCQCDHPEYGEDHISLSFGCWGQSVEIMQAVTHAIATLVGKDSKAYVLANDSTASDFIEVAIPRAA